MPFLYFALPPALRPGQPANVGNIPGLTTWGLHHCQTGFLKAGAFNRNSTEHLPFLLHDHIRLEASSSHQKAHAPYSNDITHLQDLPGLDM